MTSTPAAPSIGRVRRGANLWALACIAIAGCAAALSVWFAPSSVSTVIVFGVLTAVVCVAALLLAFKSLHFSAGPNRAGTLQAIADSSPDALVVTDRESRVVYANETYRALCRALGSSDIRQ